MNTSTRSDESESSNLDQQVWGEPTLPLSRSVLRFIVELSKDEQPRGLKRKAWQKHFTGNVYGKVCAVCGTALDDSAPGRLMNVIPHRLGGSKETVNDWLVCGGCVESVRHRDPLLVPGFSNREGSMKRRLDALERSANHVWVPSKVKARGEGELRAHLVERWAYPRAKGSCFVGEHCGIVAFDMREHDDEWLALLRQRLRLMKVETEHHLVQGFDILAWESSHHEAALHALIDTNVLLSRFGLESWKPAEVRSGILAWWSMTGESLAQFRASWRAKPSRK
ncbi:hypothetical protein [Dyella thiooxydans]|nr:hypothetical protein [Dyella thiooxydans]